MNPAIRVVVFKDGDLFIAQALEVDVAAQGQTAEEATTRLQRALRTEAREMASAGRSLFDIGPAPVPFHALYDNRTVSREVMQAA